MRKSAHPLLSSVLLPPLYRKDPFSWYPCIVVWKGSKHRVLVYERKCENDRPINSTTHLFVLSSTSTGKLSAPPKRDFNPNNLPCTSCYEISCLLEHILILCLSAAVGPRPLRGRQILLFTFPQAASSRLTASLLLALVGWMSPPLHPASVTPFFSFAPSLPCCWTVRLFRTSIIAVKLHQWLSCWQTCGPIKVRLDDQGGGSKREKHSRTSLEKEGGRERKTERDTGITVFPSWPKAE